MTDIRWENLRNLAGLTLDQLETRQHHAENQAKKGAK